MLCDNTSYTEGVVLKLNKPKEIQPFYFYMSKKSFMNLENKIHS